MKNMNIKCEKNKKGITLLALVVTIVVLLVLAGVSLNLLIGNNGIITRTQISKVSQELAAYKENMNLFIGEKQIETAEFNANTLTAYKNKLYYNTKSADDTSGIETVLGQVDNKYIEKIEIINGELCLNTTNNVEQKAAEGLGIKVNSWDVVDGVLLSSDKNLGLINNGETVVIPPSIKKIGDGAFSSVNNIKKIVIPGTVEEIGANAFSNNTTLEEVTIEYGVKKVGDYAFKGCTSLKTIEFPDSVVEIGRSAMESCSVLEKVKLSSGINYIGYYALSYTNISEITIPEGIETIKGYAFEGCTRLETVNLPSSLTEIGNGIFFSDINIKSINIDSKNINLKFENGLLMSKDGKSVYFGLLNMNSIVIPEGVKTISADTFSSSEATRISLPNSLETITGSEFTNMNKLNEIIINEDNPNYMVKDGNLYSKNGKKLVQYLKEGNEVDIPEGVTIIAAKAVRKKNISSINLPSTLIELEDYSLSETTGIEIIEIPENVEVFNTVALPQSAKIKVVNENKNIKSVDDSMVLSTDGKRLIATSRAVENFNIPSSVEIIEQNCFYNNKKIKNIMLPSGVKQINRMAFAYTSLQSITIPNTIEKIEENVFTNCAQLNKIEINKPKNSIAGSPWSCPIGDRAVQWLGK